MSQEKVDFVAKECERYGIPMSVLEHTFRAQLEQEDCCSMRQLPKNVM